MPEITEARFDELLRTFTRSAFRLETRDFYALDYEQADFDRFLAGSPVPPDQLDWWRPWLEQIARLTGEGKTISRVRVMAEPPSDYQRWEAWGARWNIEAGERVGYLTRSKARHLGLPGGDDWWLLDDERVIRMEFDGRGRIARKTLITAPAMIVRYQLWRDLAVANATPAGAFAA